MRRKVLIVGSGLAGTLLANELSERHDVTVLEAGRSGGFDYPRVRFQGKPFGQVPTFCYGEGGTTNLWHNGLMPLQPGDVTHATFRNVLLEAAPHGDRVAQALFFPGANFASERAERIKQLQHHNEQLGLFSDGIDCLIYPKSYRRLELREGISRHFGVSDIAFVGRGAGIVQVDFTTGSARQSAHPDAIVICAGALNSPRLVAQVLAALGQDNHSAGSGLMDHPMGFVGKVRVQPELARILHELSIFDAGGYHCCAAGRIAVADHLAAIYFRPSVTMTNRPSLYRYKSKLGASRGRRRLAAALSPRLFHPDVLAEIYAHILGTPIPGRTFSILAFFEQKRGSGTARYEGDELTVAWEIKSRQLEVYHAMLARLQQVLAPLSDELNLNVSIDESWLWSGAHHSGTISLGDGEGDIVDAHLRVRRSDNVYVCDASVIQEHSYANTGLTIGQLAYRLAAHLG